MNTDIRLAVPFRGHRKRKRLRLLLGPGSTDYLLDLWIATAMNHPDGILTAWTKPTLPLRWAGRASRRLLWRPCWSAACWKKLTAAMPCTIGQSTKPMSCMLKTARRRPRTPQPSDGRPALLPTCPQNAGNTAEVLPPAMRQQAASLQRAMPLLPLLFPLLLQILFLFLLSCLLLLQQRG